MRTYWKDVFGLDLRSLALLRVCVGLLVLLDLILRSRDLVAHYTDQGVLPRSELLIHQPSTVSVFLVGGSYWFVAFLFLLNAIAAIALTLGLRARLASFFCWLLLMGLQYRNPLVLNSGDVLLRLVLFWGFFLPWARVWSWDAKTHKHSHSLATSSWATAAYTIQIMLVYGFSVIWKSGETWHDGTAIYYALNIDHFVRPLGHWLLQFPESLRFLTHAVYYLEASVFFLLLSPWLVGPLRTLTVFLLVSLHVTIAFVFQLGVFGPVAVCFTLGLLPEWFWNQLQNLTSAGLLEEGGSSLSPPTESRLSRVTVIVALALTISWNLSGLFWEEKSYPSAYRSVVKLMGLEQRWNMFCPDPLRNDGWFVMEGVLKNGKSVELSRKQDQLSWEKPVQLADTYPNQRWRKVMMNLYYPQFGPFRSTVLQYFFNEWNDNHRGNWQVERIRLYYVLERTPSPGDAIEHKPRLLTEFPADS